MAPRTVTTVTVLSSTSEPRGTVGGLVRHGWLGTVGHGRSLAPPVRRDRGNRGLSTEPFRYIVILINRTRGIGAPAAAGGSAAPPSPT